MAIDVRAHRDVPEAGVVAGSTAQGRPGERVTLPRSSLRRSTCTLRVMHWQLRTRALATDRPIVVGILNVTPDSFSDGGRFTGLDASLAQADALLEAV